MIRTISLGSCVQVQGILERELSDGKLQVRVGNLLFEGYPVNMKAAK